MDSLSKRRGAGSFDYGQSGTSLQKGRCDSVPTTIKGTAPAPCPPPCKWWRAGLVGRFMQRHRHQEFIHFLNTIEANVPAGKLNRVSLDDYAAHKHPHVAQMAGATTSLHLPLHAYEVLDQRRRGRVCQVDQAAPEARRVSLFVVLQAAINCFLAETSTDRAPSDGPRPLTKSSPPSGASIKR